MKARFACCLALVTAIPAAIHSAINEHKLSYVIFIVLSAVWLWCLLESYFKPKEVEGR